MVIQLDDKLIATQLFESKFVCNLHACKGQCCVDGDAGAPLTNQEVVQIEEELESFLPYMREEGIEAIEKSGVSYLDPSGEPVTTLINGGECAFVFFDQQGTAKCAIEQAYAEGKTTFKKPISCHLYPIRVQEYNSFTALNYDEWDICNAACVLGEQLNVPIYKFLKEPIIRAWGEEFYNDLYLIDQELQNESKNEINENSI